VTNSADGAYDRLVREQFGDEAVDTPDQHTAPRPPWPGGTGVVLPLLSDNATLFDNPCQLYAEFANMGQGKPEAVLEKFVLEAWAPVEDFPWEPIEPALAGCGKAEGHGSLVPVEFHVLPSGAPPASGTEGYVELCCLGCVKVWLHKHSGVIPQDIPQDKGKQVFLV
jgi:hypothetical protein